MSKEYDINIGKQAIYMGMINSQQLSICLKIQKKYKDAGKYIPLLDILQKKQFISSQQVSKLHATTTGDFIPKTEVHKIPALIQQRYRIVNELGKGGMGVVYKGWDNNFQRDIAIKFLHGRRDSEINNSRFVREAKTMSKLQHKNIVKIYDMDTTDDSYYFTMEYVEGVNLRKYLSENKVGMRYAVKLTIEILKALEHAHQNGVIHRDIKPDNIMITQDNDVKVMDFGLAKIMEDNNKISQSGVAIGTVHYMSPEQMLGFTRSISFQSDLYSVGVTLYEMLTGKTPFIAKSFQEATRKIQQSLIPPHRIKPKIPKSLSLICTKALKRKASSRYLSATDFINDLQNFLDNKSITRNKTGLKYIILGVFICALAFSFVVLFAREETKVETSVKNDKATEIIAEKSKVNPVFFRGNAQRVGVYESPPVYQTPSVKWKFLTKDKIKSSPIIYKDIVFFGSYDQYFYAVNKNNGQLKWQIKTEGYIYSSPVIYGEIIYFGCHDGYLYAVNVKNGMEIWKFRVSHHILSSPVVDENFVYFGCLDGKIYCVDKDEGTLKWYFTTRKDIISSPALYDSIIFFGSSDNYLYAVDTKTATLKWRFLTNGAIKSTPVISNNIIFFGSFDNNFYAVDFSGNLLWQFTTGGEIHSSAAVKNDLVYIGSNDNNIYAVERLSGKLIWTYSTKGYVAASPIVVKDILYSSSFDGKIYALQRFNGQLQWEYSIPVFFSSPVIENQVLYVGGYDGFFYALH